ncbi:MAG: Holliday junction branch migration DNA helicase RuvB [Armatimonadetes bacterium]|nr:Holliday junction branch migration DNA helicase RuvB [Armatimonadota bacterium]
MRKRWVVPTPTENDDEQMLVALRPRTLDEYIGQREVVTRLRIAIEAAKQRGEPLEHLLLYGPPGLGKTTLAHIIANEMGVGIISTTAPSLERAGDVMGYLLSLKRGEVLFVDEVHRLPRHVEEFLYPVLEMFRVDFNLSKRPGAKPHRFELPPFTFIGATTKAGNLSKPMRDRFGLKFRLDFYSVEELAQIVKRSADLLGVPVDEGGAIEIARRSRGTPRIANRLLRRVRDYAQVRGDGRIDSEIARRALTMEGIDELGLDQLDRDYLTVLICEFNGGPAGLEAIAAMVQEDARTLEEMVEPFLLQLGFIRRTHQGRVATIKAYQHLGFEPTKLPQPSLPLTSD